MSHSPESVKQHVKVYINVFIALGVLTALTVAVAYFHLPLFWAVAVALIIASFKASLVAAFFMHLVSEKPVILWILILTVFFFICLMVLPALTSQPVHQ